MSANTKIVPVTADAAGQLRERLRAAGWRADVRWTAVGSGSAAAAVAAAEAARQAPPTRTIAYLSSLRTIDGGAPRVWTEGDVAVPHVADAREVMSAHDGEWISHTLEAPARTVASLPDEAEDLVAESAA